MTIALAAVALALQGPPPICPRITPVPPMPEGAQQFVHVGQMQPCPPAGAREDYAITVNFGDGTTVQSAFDPFDGLWLIGARHAYRRAGRYAVVGTVTYRPTGETRVRKSTIDIPNAALTARPTPRPTLAPTRRVVVARFRDGNVLAQPGDYRVSIGGRRRGRVVQDGPGLFHVEALMRPVRRLQVTIRDDRGALLRVAVHPRFRH